MKKINIFWNGSKLKSIYPHATAWEVFKFRVVSITKRVVAILVIGAIAYGVFLVGQFTKEPVEIYKEREVKVEVESPSPVLDRIAKCESGGNHFAPNGQVVLNANENGSVDIGVMQINVRIWGKKATEMGYNLAVEKDNRAFALYLYKNFGTEPWIFSKPCWNK